MKYNNTDWQGYVALLTQRVLGWQLLLHILKHVLLAPVSLPQIPQASQQGIGKEDMDGHTLLPVWV